jgi:hypothetical protein
MAMRVRRGYVGWGVAWLCQGAAWLCRVRRGYVGCGVAMWLARRALENPGAEVSGQIFPSAAGEVSSAAAGVSARHQG